MLSHSDWGLKKNLFKGRRKGERENGRKERMEKKEGRGREGKREETKKKGRKTNRKNGIKRERKRAGSRIQGFEVTNPKCLTQKKISTIYLK